ncbi:hypothetical protein SNEBB_008052 [Seison nebaliae]|nr:hypothetical protein SNEBB_008052 [Seison nebaliae]
MEKYICIFYLVSLSQLSRSYPSPYDHNVRNFVYDYYAPSQDITAIGPIKPLSVDYETEKIEKSIGNRLKLQDHLVNGKFFKAAKGYIGEKIGGAK